MRHVQAMILLAALALAASTPADKGHWAPALQAAARDLCGKQVALLGENGFHGDGRTVTFKATLVWILVKRCGFGAVFFEASHYDFLAIDRAVRREEEVTPAMVESAIGCVWNQDSELAPLIPFLAREAGAGRVVLGGLDDQIGSAGAFYSLETMPAELAGFLPPRRREPCLTALRQRTMWIYSDASPHDPASVDRLRACTADIRAAVNSSRAEPASRADYFEMLDNIDRAVARDFLPVKALVAGRDRSMYFNFRWLAGRLKRGTKIIVWAANSHIAKDAALDPAFTPGGNFGAYLHRDYGRRAFALGFSAAQGSFRWSKGETKPIPPAAPDSLEGQLIGRTTDEIAYAGPSALAALGARPGALFDHRNSPVARWADLFDGVVVFRSERPPVRMDE
jgi:erythromycin esterase-like protein